MELRTPNYYESIATQSLLPLQSWMITLLWHSDELGLIYDIPRLRILWLIVWKQETLDLQSSSYCRERGRCSLSEAVDRRRSF